MLPAVVAIFVHALLRLQAQLVEQLVESLSAWRQIQQLVFVSFLLVSSNDPAHIDVEDL